MRRSLHPCTAAHTASPIAPHQSLPACGLLPAVLHPTYSCLLSTSLVGSMRNFREYCLHLRLRLISRQEVQSSRVNFLESTGALTLVNFRREATFSFYRPEEIKIERVCFSRLPRNKVLNIFAGDPIISLRKVFLTATRQHWFHGWLHAITPAQDYASCNMSLASETIHENFVNSLLPCLITHLFEEPCYSEGGLTVFLKVHGEDLRVSTTGRRCRRTFPHLVPGRCRARHGHRYRHPVLRLPALSGQ